MEGILVLIVFSMYFHQDLDRLSRKLSKTFILAPLDVMRVQVMHLNHGECRMCFHHIYSQVTKVIGYPQHQLCPSTVLLTKMYISLDVFLTLLQLYFQSFVLVLYLWTVYLYCICGQWSQSIGRPTCHLFLHKPQSLPAV